MSRKHLLEARLCAVGGQGIILGSEILCHAAIFHEGLYAVQSPTYGSQVRGGATKVDIIIDKEEILYPKARNIGFFMAIAQLSFNKFWYNVADDALVLLDSNLVTKVSDDMKANRTFVHLPVVEMAKSEFNNVLLSNMICLGVIQQVTQVVTQDHLLQAVEKKVPKKHLENNIKAVKMGGELAIKELSQKMLDAAAV